MEHRSKFALIAFLAVVTISAAPSLRGSQVAPETLIASARTTVLTPHLSRDEITRALVQALDASLLILPAIDDAAEFKTRVGSVRKLFEDKAILEDKARRDLGLAYRLVSGGKDWEIPAELKTAGSSRGSIEKATELCAQLLDSALAEQKAGRNAEACRALLGFVLLVITPIEA